MDGGRQNIIRFAEFELDPARRSLSRLGEPVALNAKAYEVLVHLARNAGRVVSKDELLETVWEGQIVEEANLAVQISRLRKALGDPVENPRILCTVPGKGYEFVAPTGDAELARAENAAALSAQAFVAPPDHPAGPLRSAAGRRKGRVRRAVAGIVLLAVAAWAAAFWFGPPEPAVDSIAVLPFINQNPDAEAEYLSDGLTESVTYALSGLPRLRVMSRNSAFRYKGRRIDAGAVGRELGVGAVLIGRVRQYGDRLSVSAELVSTEDNSVLWGENFTRRTDDLETLRTDIARAISAKLQLRLTGADEARLERSGTDDAEAFQLYLLGRYQLNKLTDEGFFRARDHFQEAVERDPDYALAHVGLADAYNRLSGWNALAQTEGFPKARQAAQRALEIDPELSEAHTALGTVRMFHDWDWDGAGRDLEKALALDPDNAEARLMHGFYLLRLGRFEEALVEAENAQRLDPLAFDKHAAVGEVYFFKRDYEEALRRYRRMLEMDPESGFAHWALGNVYVQKGMYEEAIEAYRKSIPLSGDSPDEPASLAYAFARAGQREEALKIVRELEDRARNSYVSPVIIAMVHAGLGEADEAFRWLEKGYGQRDSLLTQLGVEPAFDPLRSDPRFRNLVRRVGLPSSVNKR